MDNLAPKRILQLKDEQGLSDLDFAGKAKVSVTTLYRLQAAADGDANIKIKGKTISEMAQNLGANPAWALTGKGNKMLAESASKDSWKDQAYAQLMATNAYLQKKVDDLLQMQGQLISALPGKNKALVIPSSFEQAGVQLRN